jgi:hypothetical protein
MLALLVSLALAVPAAQTWTVDDDGPADFAEISDAIENVAPGDVLLVEPGTYASFLLEEPLTILGRAGGERPHVLGDVRIIAESFTLAGLDLDRLRVNGVSGRGRIDDCTANVVQDLVQEYAVTVDGCAELVVSRTHAQGSYAYSEGHPNAGGAAMSIRTSNVTLVDCALEGAHGKDQVDIGPAGGTGGVGLRVSEAAQVLAAGTWIRGGGEGLAAGLFGCFDGYSGAGVFITDSALTVRGSAFDPVNAGPADSICGTHEGFDVHAVGSTVVVSGVAFDAGNTLFMGSTLVQPAVPEPYVEITGTGAPGGTRTVELHGPPGEVALLAASLSPALVPLGAFEGKAWLDPGALFLVLPVPMAGHETPVLLSWTLPASTAGIEGLAVELQPFFPGLTGAVNPALKLAGNVAELIIRF